MATKAPAAPEYLNDKQKDDLRKEIEDFKTRSIGKRRAKEGKWRLIRRFYEGDQWIRLSKDPSGQWSLEEAPINEGRPKVTINKIMPGVATRLSHVLKNQPIGVVVPESNDEEDRDSARIADEVVDFDFRRVRMQDKLARQIGPEMFLTNNCFAKVYQDLTAGPIVDVKRIVTDEATGDPLLDEAKNPVEEVTGQRPTGEPTVDVVFPEEFLPEPGINDLDDMQMVLHRTLKTLDYVKRTFGDAAKDVKPIDPDSDTGSSIAEGAKQYGYSEDDVKNRVELLEAWARPDIDKWPQGLHAVFADEICLLAEPTPKGHRAIPFVHFQETPCPWDFWGVSTAMQAIDPQRTLNVAVSRDEYRRTTQRPKLWVPTEAGVDEEDLDNDDKSAVTFTYPFTGKWEAPPAYVADERAREFYLEAIDEGLGNVAILQGQADGEVRSGRQAFIQGEFAGTVLSGPARSIERGMCSIGNMLLDLRKAWTDDEVTLNIVGRDRNIEVMHFKSSDLQGAGSYWVQPGSALPMSRAEKRQLILDLWDRGILSLDRRDRVLKMIDMPSDLDALVNEDQIDRDRANEENDLFLSLSLEGIQAARANALLESQQDAAVGLEPDDMGATLRNLNIEPRDFENHDIHLERHNRFRKSRKYRALPREAQAVVDEHCDKHSQFGAMMMGATSIAGAAEAGDGAGDPSQDPSVTPGALMPGGKAQVGGSFGAGAAEQAGDLAAGMPKMPKTPTPGGMRQQG